MLLNVEVKESELLTFRVRGDGKIFWNIGTDEPDTVNIKKLKELAERENLKKAVRNRLITSLKVSPEASYGTVVEILDELNLAEIKISEVVATEKDEEGNPTKRKRKFTLANFTDEDAKLIGEDTLKLGAKK
jgi:biopolymer transport protein ExbD